MSQAPQRILVDPLTMLPTFVNNKTLLLLPILLLLMVLVPVLVLALLLLMVPVPVPVLLPRTAHPPSKCRQVPTQTVLTSQRATVLSVAEP